MFLAIETVVVRVIKSSKNRLLFEVLIDRFKNCIVLSRKCTLNKNK